MPNSIIRDFRIPRKSKDQIEKEKEAKQERIRNEEEAAAKRAAEEITNKKSPKQSSFKPTFDSKDPLGLISRPDHGLGDGGDTTLIRSLYIDDIPAELAELCPAHKCILCGIKTLNSDTHARSHYLGKQHNKKAQVRRMKDFKISVYDT